RRRHTFEFQDPLAYLYQAVRNEAVSYRRRQVTQEHALVRVANAPAPASRDGATETEAGELAAAVAAAVDALPERCRLIFTMNREQGLSYAEIAAALGLSVKTVENQMSRAFKALRIRLTPFLGL